MNLYDMLKQDEGEKLTLYKDSEGYWTVGVGHLVTKSPDYLEAVRVLSHFTGDSSGKISSKQSELFLNQDIQKALSGIQRSTLNDTYTKLDEHRRMALVNMVFQLGLTGVLGFKKMINYLNRGDYVLAAQESLDSKWYKQTPNRAKRVSNVLKTGTLVGY